jgi:hypothetical protein
MDGEHFLPVGEGKLLDRMDDLDAGIADEDVDGTELADGLRDAGIDLILAGNVHGHSDGLAGAHLAELGRRRLGIGLLEIGNRNAAPSAMKRSAISRPMPLAAPVMTATFFSSFMIKSLL